MSIDVISEIRMELDRVFDHLPVVSTLSNLIVLFEKYVYYPLKEKVGFEKGRYAEYLEEKDLCHIGLVSIPLLNIAAAHFGWGKTKPKALPQTSPKEAFLTAFDQLRETDLGTKEQYPAELAKGPSLDGVLRADLPRMTLKWDEKRVLMKGDPRPHQIEFDDLLAAANNLPLQKRNELIACLQQGAAAELQRRIIDHLGSSSLSLYPLAHCPENWIAIRVRMDLAKVKIKKVFQLVDTAKSGREQVVRYIEGKIDIDMRSGKAKFRMKPLKPLHYCENDEEIEQALKGYSGIRFQIDQIDQLNQTLSEACQDKNSYIPQFDRDLKGGQKYWIGTTPIKSSSALLTAIQPTIPDANREVFVSLLTQRVPILLRQKTEGFFALSGRAFITQENVKHHVVFTVADDLRLITCTCKFAVKSPTSSSVLGRFTGVIEIDTQKDSALLSIFH